jgi:hypothetical protein
MNEKFYSEADTKYVHEDCKEKKTTSEKTALSEMVMVIVISKEAQQLYTSFDQ